MGGQPTGNTPEASPGQGKALAKAVLGELLKRWPKLLFVALLWGLSRVCDFAEEPWQSACELLVKLGKVVTP